MISVAAYLDPPIHADDSHRSLRLFVGADSDHRALAGRITVRAEEARDLLAVLNNVGTLAAGLRECHLDTGLHLAGFDGGVPLVEALTGPLDDEQGEAW